MKTKEFIERVKSLGLDVEYDYHSYEENLEVVLFNALIANVSNDCEYELLVEYSSTPIEERDKEKNEAEKEKKYYLKHKWMSFKRERYLKCIGGEYCLHDTAQSTKHKMKFTQGEIDKIKAKFGTDLNDFEMIEAKGE